MTLPFSQHFDAYLPGIAGAIRITSLQNAQVFTRRWAIRDKDRTIKVLLRALDRANSIHSVDAAIADFRKTLRARGLLEAPRVET